MLKRMGLILTIGQWMNLSSLSISFRKSTSSLTTEMCLTQMMNGTLFVIEGKLNGNSELMKSYRQLVQQNDSENMRKVNKLDNKIVGNLNRVSKISRE